MKKWMISLLSVLAFALAFSGCGGSEGGTKATNDVVAPSQPVVTPPTGGGNTVNNDETLVASKSSIENVFGAVPANPGQAN